jgi:opacity protein-like surface antigen
MSRSILLALLAALLGATSAWATTQPQVGVGVFGGFSVPVLQDVDVSSFSPSDAFGPTGTQFGIRAPVKIIPVVTLEPFFAKSNYKDQEETFNGLTYTRQGYDGTAFGLNAILGQVGGPGVKFYPYLGLGSFKLSRDSDEITKMGWNFGVGLGISPAPRWSIQIRPEFNMVVTGDTSRKFGNMTVGVNYELPMGREP